MSQWVQHISGQGEKWKVQSQYDLTVTDYWIAHNHSTEYRSALHLPKSEYVLCDPPKQWVDVTAECEYTKHGIARLANLVCEGGYRLRKVRVYQTDGTGSKPNYEMAAFIVEKQVQP